MTSLFVVLLAMVAVAICSLREDSPAARAPRRVWADLQASGWKRVTWLIACGVAVAVAVAFVALYAAARTGLYGACIAVAALACWGASRAAMDNRPVRIRRLEIAR